AEARRGGSAWGNPRRRGGARAIPLSSCDATVSPGGAAVNFNKSLTTLVVIVFIGICAWALLRRAPDAGGGAPASAPAAAADPMTLLLSSSNAKTSFIDKAVEEFN